MGTQTQNEPITVRVRDHAAEEAAWGSPGLFRPYIRTITLPRFTARGERRSDPQPLNQCEDGYYFTVDTWTLDSGRTETYAEALRQAVTRAPRSAAKVNG